VLVYVDGFEEILPCSNQSVGRSGALYIQNHRAGALSTFLEISSLLLVI